MAYSRHYQITQENTPYSLFDYTSLENSMPYGMPYYLANYCIQPISVENANSNFNAREFFKNFTLKCVANQNW